MPYWNDKIKNEARAETVKEIEQKYVGAITGTAQKWYPQEPVGPRSDYSFPVAKPPNALVFWNGMCLDDGDYTWSTTTNLHLNFNTSVGDKLWVYC